jgi:MarR family transcriptional regulator for hemolysin
LNSMDTEGLITRERDPANRRVHIVRLTSLGEEKFLALRDAAIAFDQRLRRGVAEADLDTVEELLARLAGNVAPEQPGAAPWAGLVAGEEL